MNIKARYIEEFQAKLRHRVIDIDDLRGENDLAKNQIVVILKKDRHPADFTEKVEHFLELLLHTEQVIEVLRHDVSDLVLAANAKDLEKKFEDLVARLQVIEKDILKTANLIENVKIAIEDYSSHHAS